MVSSSRSRSVAAVKKTKPKRSKKTTDCFDFVFEEEEEKPVAKKGKPSRSGLKTKAAPKRKAQAPAKKTQSSRKAPVPVRKTTIAGKKKQTRAVAASEPVKNKRKRQRAAPRQFPGNDSLEAADVSKEVAMNLVGEASYCLLSPGAEGDVDRSAQKPREQSSSFRQGPAPVFQAPWGDPRKRRVRSKPGLQAGNTAIGGYAQFVSPPRNLHKLTATPSPVAGPPRAALGDISNRAPSTPEGETAIKTIKTITTITTPVADAAPGEDGYESYSPTRDIMQAATDMGYLGTGPSAIQGGKKKNKKKNKTKTPAELEEEEEFHRAAAEEAQEMKAFFAALDAEPLASFC